MFLLNLFASRGVLPKSFVLVSFLFCGKFIVNKSVPTYSVTKLVIMIKSLTARHIFKQYPEVKRQLWGGEFWSDGFFANTVSKHGDESVIRNHIKNQDNDAKYMKLHDSNQLMLFNE